MKASFPIFNVIEFKPILAQCSIFIPPENVLKLWFFWHIQGLLPTNCLSVFNHFFGVALKGLNSNI